MGVYGINGKLEIRKCKRSYILQIRVSYTYEIRKVWYTLSVFHWNKSPNITKIRHSVFHWNTVISWKVRILLKYGIPYPYKKGESKKTTCTWCRILLKYGVPYNYIEERESRLYSPYIHYTLRRQYPKWIIIESMIESCRSECIYVYWRSFCNRYLTFLKLY